jgi:hypothetical protein
LALALAGKTPGRLAEMAGEGRHEIADARDIHFTCHCWSSYESGASASFNLGIGVGNYDLALSDLEVDLFDFDEVVHVAAAGSRVTYTYAPMPPPPPMPEPARWAMMIGGLALVGSALRRRAVPSARWHQDAGACA